jgi:anti-sigma regulatory factor (Ser/Thr protein kinase)
MEDLSLHILDIVENSFAAAAKVVKILISEDTERDSLRLEIVDDGKGMSEEMRKNALNPFFTTRTTRRVGLGLPLLAQAARDTGGDLDLESAPGKGTTVRATFQLSHPDRKPLGDIAATLMTIQAARPEVELVFQYEKDGQVVASLDSRRQNASESEELGKK